MRGSADEAPPRFWQLNQFQPVGWINAAMRDGPWKLVRPQLAQPPKTDTDKRVMERYVEVDIQYKYHPDEVTELMSEPDPDLIVPSPADIELYNIDDDPPEKTIGRWRNGLMGLRQKGGAFDLTALCWR